MLDYFRLMLSSVVKNWYSLWKVDVWIFIVSIKNWPYDLWYLTAPSTAPPPTGHRDEPWENEVEDLVTWSSKLDTAALDE